MPSMSCRAHGPDCTAVCSGSTTAATALPQVSQGSKAPQTVLSRGEDGEREGVHHVVQYSVGGRLCPRTSIEEDEAERHCVKSPKSPTFLVNAGALRLASLARRREP